MISGSTKPIFIKSSPYGRYLIVIPVWRPFFRWLKRRHGLATNFRFKIGKIVIFTFEFVALTFGNGLQYRHSGFNKLICGDLAILFVNLVNVGPVTAEFLRGSSACTLIEKNKSFEKTYLRIYLIDFYRSPCDRYLQIKDQTFSDRSRAVAVATNFSVKLAKSAYGHIRRPGIQKRIAISTSDLKRFICDDLATSCKHDELRCSNSRV